MCNFDLFSGSLRNHKSEHPSHNVRSAIVLVMALGSPPTLLASFYRPVPPAPTTGDPGQGLGLYLQLPGSGHGGRNVDIRQTYG